MDALGAEASNPAVDLGPHEEGLIAEGTDPEPVSHPGAESDEPVTEPPRVQGERKRAPDDIAGLERLQDGLTPSLREANVGVLEEEHVPLRLPRGQVELPGETSLGLEHPVGMPRREVSRSIPAPAVHDHDGFHPPTPKTPERILETFRLVECGHYRGDPRLHEADMMFETAAMGQGI